MIQTGNAFGTYLYRTVGNLGGLRECFRFHRETWARGFGGGRSALTPPIGARILGLGADLALAAFHLFAVNPDRDGERDRRTLNFLERVDHEGGKNWP